jgi:hypothetical protein
MNGAKQLFIICLFLIGIVSGVQAQSTNCKWVKGDGLEKGVRLDSLSILPESIIVKDAQDRAVPYNYDFSSGIFQIEKGSLNSTDSVNVCYDAIPYNFNAVFSHRSLEKDYDSAALFKDRRVAAAPSFDFREEIFPTSNLNKSGNLTRGISFGNTQNVFVNSSLNLQMDGQLADNLNIRASITDQNVPFQPEGNTQ